MHALCATAAAAAERSCAQSRPGRERVLWRHTHTAPYGAPHVAPYRTWSELKVRAVLALGVHHLLHLQVRRHQQARPARPHSTTQHTPPQRRHAPPAMDAPYVRTVGNPPCSRPHVQGCIAHRYAAAHLTPPHPTPSRGPCPWPRPAQAHPAARLNHSSTYTRAQGKAHQTRCMHACMAGRLTACRACRCTARAGRCPPASPPLRA